MRDIYLLIEGQQSGPYAKEQIQTFLKQGMIASSDLVWAEGWANWTSIGDVPALRYAIPNVPPYPMSVPPGETGSIPSQGDKDKWWTRKQGVTGIVILVVVTAVIVVPCFGTNIAPAGVILAVILRNTDWTGRQK